MHSAHNKILCLGTKKNLSPGFARILRPETPCDTARFPTGPTGAQLTSASAHGHDEWASPDARSSHPANVGLLLSQARRARRFQSFPHHSLTTDHEARSHSTSLTRRNTSSEFQLPTAASASASHGRSRTREHLKPHGSRHRPPAPFSGDPVIPDASPPLSVHHPDAATCRRSPFRRPLRPRSSPTRRQRPRLTSPCPSTSRTRNTPHGPQPRRRCLCTTPSIPCPKSSRYARAAPYD